jgi:hypothetical protein
LLTHDSFQAFKKFSLCTCPAISHFCMQNMCEIWRNFQAARIHKDIGTGTLVILSCTVWLYIVTINLRRRAENLLTNLHLSCKLLNAFVFRIYISFNNFYFLYNIWYIISFFLFDFFSFDFLKIVWEEAGF